MKRINKRIFCTLTLISSTFLPYLTINAKATTDILGAKKWTEDSGNIKNGQNGFMFEDSWGNLWSAGFGTPLQKYDYSTHTWETSDDIAGNLKDGGGGFMFQDKRGNLWSAGYGTPLQRYDYDNSRWETDKKLKIKNAGNLKNGQNGFMFQDSKGNLWSVGNDTPLQKYDHGTSTWESNSKISGNLKNGWNGFMFQDKRGNLWSAGYDTPLQRYDYAKKIWETNWKIRGNILDGYDGFMFEDSRANLWSAGYGAFLQKFDNGSNIWKTSKKIMRIQSSGFGGFMFQDKRGNLWSSGHGTPLQKYNYITSTWETSAPISQNLKDDLKNGWSSFMFQDSKGNLWSVGNDTPLQKYDYDNDVWETSDAIKGNISNGGAGFIFEDSKGHLWSAGYGTKLQVMYSDKDVASVIALIQANSGMTKDVATDIPLKSNAVFNVAALNSLGTGGTFPGDTKGTTLTYSHGGITSDGPLVVTVKITKGTATAFATFTVDVSGIDVVKKDKIQEANLQALKTQLTSGAVTKTTDKAGTIAVRITDTASLKAETGIDLTKLANSSTYVISAAANGTSGTITISVIMTTSGAASEISEVVTYTIYHKSNDDVDAANKADVVDTDSIKVTIENIIGMAKDIADAISPVDIDMQFDANVLSLLGIGGTFPSDIKDTTLTYSHGGATSDGPLVVTVKITKGKATAFANFNIAIGGIDLANANKAKVQKEVDKFKNFNSVDSLNSVAAILSPLNTENIKTQFEAITGYIAPSLTDGYSISKVIVKTVLDPKTKKVAYTITISDTNSNTATKDIVVTFAVKAISKDKDLSKGAIAGITIGSILGIGIFGFLIYHLFKKLKK